MKRWFKRIALGVLALIVLLCAVATIDYLSWRAADRRKAVIGGSTVVATARGPVEYVELGRGRPMLMIHGSPGGFDVTYAWLRRVHGDSGPPYRAILPSRPGYLRTPLSTGRTPAEQADAMAALLDVLGVRRTAVYGISDGGPSAIQFALRHNDRCSALVLVSAVSQRIAMEDFPWWTRILDRVMSGEVGAWILTRLTPMVLGNEARGDAQALAEMNAYMDGLTPYGPRAAGALNDQVQDRRMEAWPLRDIKCPTLVIHGTADWIVPPAHGDSSATIPGAKAIRIDGAAHLAFIVHRAQVDAAIAAFLTEHPN